ncbi:HotDog domain-containing protein [Aspergillus californicus]
MPRALSSTLTRAVSTTTRLHVSYPHAKGLMFARSLSLNSSLLSQRSYSTAGASSINYTPRSRLRRFFGFVSIATIAFFAGSTFGIATTMVPFLSDEESLTVFAPSDEFTKKIESHIHNHPLVASLREDPAFAASRPYMKIPESIRGRNLTAGTLSNPEGIVVPPLVYCNKEASSLVSIVYLGPNVSGHPGIVHGGLLATLLDEGMGRCAFQVLPNNIGVTANLNIDYRRPAMAKNYFVLRAQVVKSEGRKAWVEAHIETLPEEGQEPEVLVEAKSLFIEPKYAASMKKLANFS